MYTVHILQKLPIAWQIYPDSPKVNAVITDLVQDLEEDLIAYEEEEVQQGLNVQHKCKHKQCQDNNYLNEWRQKLSPPTAMYRVEEKDIWPSDTFLFLYCCLQPFNCLKLDVILNVKIDAVKCIAESCIVILLYAHCWVLKLVLLRTLLNVSLLFEFMQIAEC